MCKVPENDSLKNQKIHKFKMMTYRGIAAVEQRFGLSQQQAMIGVHYVGLLFGFIVLFLIFHLLVLFWFIEILTIFYCTLKNILILFNSQCPMLKHQKTKSRL